jgi:hypothetical protein
VASDYGVISALRFFFGRLADVPHESLPDFARTLTVRI